MSEDKACRELEPCPFCGAGSDRIILQVHEAHTHTIATFMPDHPGSATIECGGCNVGMIEDTAAEVIAAWNRRAAKPAVPEGLVELLRDIRPKYGDVGSRDVDVAEQQRKIDAAIAMLSAAPPLPVAQGQDAKDAARYRWLRGGSELSARWSHWRIEHWDGSNGWDPMQNESMDAAIDTAIAVAPKEPT